MARDQTPGLPLGTQTLLRGMAIIEAVAEGATHPVAYWRPHRLYP
jgi:hypothetical protein